MASDRLYELAALYKKTKLWKKLTDTALFGVRLPDGRIGYCCVMGMNNEYIALAVYCGTEGLDTYRRVCDNYEKSEVETLWNGFAQDCLQCSFEAKDDLFPEELEEARDYGKRNRVSFRGKWAFPRFLNCMPHRLPAPISTPEEEQILSLALEAAIATAGALNTYAPKGMQFTAGSMYGRKIPVLERNGNKFEAAKIDLPDPLPTRFTSPRLDNEILAGKMKRAKKKGNLVCELLHLPTPTATTDEDGKEFLSFPVMLLACNTESGYLLPNIVVVDFPREKENLLSLAAEEMLQEKSVPKTILVRDGRTQAFLGTFCKQTGIHLQLENSKKISLLLDELEADFLDCMRQADVDDLPGEDSIISYVLKTLANFSDQEIRNAPKELRASLRQMFDTGYLPPDLERRLKRLLH